MCFLPVTGRILFARHNYDLHGLQSISKRPNYHSKFNIRIALALGCFTLKPARTPWPYLNVVMRWIVILEDYLFFVSQHHVEVLVSSIESRFHKDYVIVIAIVFSFDCLFT